MSAPFRTEFQSIDDATNWAIDWLGQNGFTVSKVEYSPWETPAQICARLDFNLTSLSRSLRRGDAPHAEIERAKTGRILRIRSNPLFDAWLLARRNPGRRHASHTSHSSHPLP